MQNYSAQLRNYGFLIIIFIFAFLFLILMSRGGGNQKVNLDDFAQCLTTNGYVMYGAYWCPHCQNEKKGFGESFQFIDYVECTEEPKQCTDAGVKGYPTWTGPDGIRLEGEQGVERMSEVSGCALSANP